MKWGAAGVIVAVGVPASRVRWRAIVSETMRSSVPAQRWASSTRTSPPGLSRTTAGRRTVAGSVARATWMSGAGRVGDASAAAN